MHDSIRSHELRRNKSVNRRPALYAVARRAEAIIYEFAIGSPSSRLLEVHVAADRTERPTWATPLHSPSSGPKIADVVVPNTAGHRDQKREDDPWFAA